MNSDKVLIVVLLVIGIVVFANLAMFAWARSMRGLNFDWFKNMRGSVSQPFKSEDDSLDELRQKVGELQKSGEKDEE